ncbi:hypothetical protein BpHYR1_029289 [Brachionus plicatilis]|uniref:Uncharacterized protein n=1 Tax=Brachionus plicatilis TaxID=10195 RepID=A0A3M7PE15_BRAPC|nr:hypothetical protein BpHYR1_029289 [Brachionus plicatilis]
MSSTNFSSVRMNNQVQFVPCPNRPESTKIPELNVTRHAMIASSLNIDGNQIEVKGPAHVIVGLKQMVGYFFGEPSVNFHDRIFDQAANNRLHATLVRIIERIRFEVGMTQHHWHVSAFVKFAINSRVLCSDHGVTKSSGSSGFVSKQNGQVFIVGNVLNLGNNNSPGFVEHCLIGPLWVQFGQDVSYSVVLTDHERVKSHQACVLIASVVASLKAAFFFGKIQTVRWSFFVVFGQQVATRHHHSALAHTFVSQLCIVFNTNAINGRTIQKSCLHVQLASFWTLAHWIRECGCGSGEFNAFVGHLLNTITGKVGRDLNW